MKKCKDKKSIKSYIKTTSNPFFISNVDYKVVLRTLAESLKKVLPVLISHEETACVKDRFIWETSGRISDIIVVNDALNTHCLLVTMDI